MKKIELLSPVQNKNTLYQAIHNGADAVYLAAKDYGARKYADNFTKEELKEVIEYAHLYGVKVYITVNTIIYEQETKEFIEFIKYLYLINTDALIMQDIGMIKLVKDLLPDFEIHASTQCNINNDETLQLLKSLGVKRAVLARETSLETINNLKTPIEKEVFVHGALCVCYSGCCLFSYMHGKRSANRGECVGACRLPYKLLEENIEINNDYKYLLSAKDLCTINNLKELLDSNIDALKIEGRMKGEEYVGYVTRLYRILIDKYYNNENLIVTKEEINNLKVIYNREFTNGYLFNKKNNEIINIKSPNHIGIKIGTVVDYNKNKLKIKLFSELNQQDGIRFTSNNKGMIVNYLYDEHDKLINSSSDIVYLDNKLAITDKCEVLKTFDYKLSQDLKKIKEKKIPIKFTLIAHLNKPLQLTVTDYTNTITMDTNQPELSKNHPTTKQDIIVKLNKINNTPFIIDKLNLDIEDNIFIPLSLLNNLKRDILLALITKRTTSNRTLTTHNITNYKNNYNNKLNLNILVRNEAQLQTCLKYNLNTIYIDNYNLYQKYKSNYSNLYLVLDRINYKYKDFNNENLLVSDLGSIYKYNKNNQLASDYFLNIINSYSLNYLSSLHVNNICLSIESNFNNTKDIINNYYERYKVYPNIELLIYGKIELMITKYCLLNTLLNKDKTCSLCKNNNKYYLLDDKNLKYNLEFKNCYMHIYNNDNLIVNNLEDYLNIGIKTFRINLYDETKDETEKIINNYLSLIKL